MQLPPSKPHPELDRLLAQSLEAVKAMTPEQKGAMLRAQRRSWVIGELMLENEGLSYGEAARRVDVLLTESGW